MSPHLMIGAMIGIRLTIMREDTHFAEQCEINYIKKFEQITEKKYDAIVLNNVVEHLHDSPKVLLNELCEV